MMRTRTKSRALADDRYGFKACSSNLEGLHALFSEGKTTAVSGFSRP